MGQTRDNKQESTVEDKRNGGNATKFGSCLSPPLFGHALKTIMKRIFYLHVPSATC